MVKMKNVFEWVLFSKSCMSSVKPVKVFLFETSAIFVRKLHRNCFILSVMPIDNSPIEICT